MWGCFSGLICMHKCITVRCCGCGSDSNCSSNTITFPPVGASLKYATRTERAGCHRRPAYHIPLHSVMIRLTMYSLGFGGGCINSHAFHSWEVIYDRKQRERYRKRELRWCKQWMQAIIKAKWRKRKCLCETCKSVSVRAGPRCAEKRNGNARGVCLMTWLRAHEMRRGSSKARNKAHRILLRVLVTLTCMHLKTSLLIHFPQVTMETKAICQ